MPAPSAPSGFLPEPASLPAPGSAERWPWLQALGRQKPLRLEPWLRALEHGELEPQSDLLAVLADQLDADATLRLLRLWMRNPERSPSLPHRVGHVRDNAIAELLIAALADGSDALLEPAWRPLLLPLLGHQRRAGDFQVLRRLALEPGPLQLRLSALEGLSLGLSAWPLTELRNTLMTLATDLDPRLAAAAVDALARLPRARSLLIQLRRSALDASVAERLERRLRALPAHPLLLVVHGRADGVIPPLIRSLAAELERRRGAPVALRALTDPEPLSSLPMRESLALVPLFLLPGGHVRHDLQGIAAELRCRGSVRLLPFLGSWPLFQRVLAQEVEREGADGAVPRLLHHRVDGPLPERYLALLERVTGAPCLPTPESPADLAQLAGAHRGRLIPLTLGPSRLSDALIPIIGADAAAPLLARPPIWTMVLQALEELP